MVKNIQMLNNRHIYIIVTSITSPVLVTVRITRHSPDMIRSVQTYSTGHVQCRTQYMTLPMEGWLRKSDIGTNDTYSECR